MVINNQEYDCPEQEKGNFPEKEKAEMGNVMLGKKSTSKGKYNSIYLTLQKQQTTGTENRSEVTR